jgi:hypothetical protein
MGAHDQYGKQVLRLAAGSYYLEDGPSCCVDYGTSLPARIDGTVGNDIAVEVESRVSKQVRGAVLDLICHPYPKKLLVLLPAHMSNPTTTKTQCETIFARFLQPKDFCVIILSGTGGEHRVEEDVVAVRVAIDLLS